MSVIQNRGNTMSNRGKNLAHDRIPPEELAELRAKATPAPWLAYPDECELPWKAITAAVNLISGHMAVRAFDPSMCRQGGFKSDWTPAQKELYWSFTRWIAIAKEHRVNVGHVLDVVVRDAPAPHTKGVVTYALKLWRRANGTGNGRGRK